MENTSSVLLFCRMLFFPTGNLTSTSLFYIKSLLLFEILNNFPFILLLTFCKNAQEEKCAIKLLLSRCPKIRASSRLIFLLYIDRVSQKAPTMFRSICLQQQVRLPTWRRRKWSWLSLLSSASEIKWAKEISDQKRPNKRFSDSFMQLHWDQGQQAYHTLKGSCYSECRCEVCGTFCHIMWRLLEIRVRVWKLLGGGAASHWSESAVEVKEVHFLWSADEDNLKNPRWGGGEGGLIGTDILFNLVLLALVDSYIVGYIKAWWDLWVYHTSIFLNPELSESNLSFS